MDRQYIASEDPCTIYSTTFVRDLFLTLCKSSFCFFFSKIGHPVCKKERVLNMYEIIKILQQNHQQMNSITNTHFLYCFFEDLITAFIIHNFYFKHETQSQCPEDVKPHSINNSCSIWSSSLFYVFLEPCTFGNILLASQPQ